MSGYEPDAKEAFVADPSRLLFTRQPDVETQAITACAEVLEPLDEAQRKRVLGYLGERFNPDADPPG